MPSNPFHASAPKPEDTIDGDGWSYDAETGRLRAEIDPAQAAAAGLVDRVAIPDVHRDYVARPTELPDADEHPLLIIHLQASGAVRFEEAVHAAEELPTVLLDQVREQPDARVVLAVEGNTPGSRLGYVLTHLNRAGIEPTLHAVQAPERRPD